MNWKLFLKISLGVVAFVVLVKLLTIAFVEPWVGKKIEAAVNESSRYYMVEVGTVHISMLSAGVELNSISIYPKQEQSGDREINGRIGSVRFNGINLVKAIFEKDVFIDKITISDSKITGEIPFLADTLPPTILPLNIRIGSLVFDRINLSLKNTLNAQTYLVKEGVLKVYDIQVNKQDTLAVGIVKQFDFEALQLYSVSADSLYSYGVEGVRYSETSKTLALRRFAVHPNYSDYGFTARSEFQTDRFEAEFSNITAYDFSAVGYFKAKSMVSSYVEIGKVDLKVFRDKRKKFRHVNRPTFQEVIYNYPGAVDIDSIGIKGGSISYAEHAEQAHEPGIISFNDVHVVTYKITNDSIYKTKDAFFEIHADALVMGKGKMTILLKGKLFDSQNTFSLNGRLSAMEAKDLNPMLEKNAFVFASSGTIDAMNFIFTANNAKATGKTIMLYHGLSIAIKNKRTDDTTAFKERVISMVANLKVLDSNPIVGEAVREGIIDNNRDPEKFLFNYCFKSILSGIKTSIVKNPKKGKKL